MDTHNDHGLRVLVFVKAVWGPKYSKVTLRLIVTLLPICVIFDYSSASLNNMQ